LIAVFLVLAPGLAALADDGFSPPEPRSARLWQAYVAAIVAVLAICVLGFKNAKRTHLD